MRKIEKIIANLETIKSRDTANHKDECKCELCESLDIAKYIKKTRDKIRNSLEHYILGNKQTTKGNNVV